MIAEVPRQFEKNGTNASWQLIFGWIVINVSDTHHIYRNQDLFYTSSPLPKRYLFNNWAPSWGSINMRWLGTLSVLIKS